MKVFIALCCLAAVYATPVKRSPEGDRPPPLTVQAFTAILSGGVTAVSDLDGDIQEFMTVAHEETSKDFTEADFEKLGNHWEAMLDRVGGVMMDASDKLVGILHAIFSDNSANFLEQDVCDNYKNFNAQFDPADPNAYITAMRDAFFADAPCFINALNNVESLQQDIDNLGAQVTERQAAQMTMDMLQDLHIIMLNKIRFAKAVEAAASQINIPEEPETRELQTLMQLRSLLNKLSHK